MIELDDFMMLGTTVPEPTSSGRIFVCSAGYSVQLRQLLRVYPLARRNVPTRWHRFQVRLERPPPQDDSRIESWKVMGDRSPGIHERINERFTDLGEWNPERRAVELRRLMAPSIQVLNERRASLGLIHPCSVSVEIEHCPDHPDSPAMRLFDPTVYDIEPDAPRFPVIPRLRFTDQDGDHRLMLRDWGTFELLRKKGPEYVTENLARALHLRPTSALLVGNLSHHRTSWLVISVLNGLVESHASLPFDAVDNDNATLVSHWDSQPLPQVIR